MKTENAFYFVIQKQFANFTWFRTACITSVDLVIDIGNTHSKIACFDRDEIVESIRFENQNYTGIGEWILKRGYKNAIYCSVGRISEYVMSVIKKQSLKVLCLNRHTPLPFRVVYKTPDTLGYDRIAAAAGSIRAFPGENVMIFDFGTAITIDFVSATGEYRGGNISPGLNIRFRSLHDHTAGLPFVERDGNYPFLGEDTKSAIVAGVQQGIIFEITGYIEACEKRYSNCKFIATGGDSGFIAGMMSGQLISYPDLVLEGLNYILDYNAYSLRI
ncbi:MAG: type III pantothenate kinase [Bacteroidales bacterium]|nr:type III pantothenate kinase [Bacteroidales bacterium]